MNHPPQLHDQLPDTPEIELSLTRMTLLVRAKDADEDDLEMTWFSNGVIVTDPTRVVTEPKQTSNGTLWTSYLTITRETEPDGSAIRCRVTDGIDLFDVDWTVRQ